MATELADAVRSAAAAGDSLYIQGGGSKLRRLGRRCDAAPLSVAGHRGVVEYRPAEMVMTARAGTPIRELRELAASEGQRLAFDAPEFDGVATLGGTLACNASGPARPWIGSVRDAVLGLRLIDGRGQQLRFGGEVIKNVAGYDMSRFQAGALGCLGLITEVSYRLLPGAEARRYLARDCDAPDAVDALRALAARPLPLSGALWYRGRLHLRFTGSAAALDAVAARHPEFQDEGDELWTSLREWQIPELAEPRTRWMLDLAPATAGSAQDWVGPMDWAGARRYLDGDLDLGTVQRVAQSCGGQVQGLWGGDRASAVLAEPAAPLRALLERIKKAVDPARVFNPGRLHGWL